MCSLNTSYQVLLQHKDYDGSEGFYVKAGRLRALCASYQAAGQTLIYTATGHVGFKNWCRVSSTMASCLASAPSLALDSNKVFLCRVIKSVHVHMALSVQCSCTTGIHAPQRLCDLVT